MNLIILAGIALLYGVGLGMFLVVKLPKFWIKKIKYSTS